MKIEIGNWYWFISKVWRQKMLGEVMRTEEKDYTTFYVMKIHKRYRYDIEVRDTKPVDASGTLLIPKYCIINKASKSELLMEMLD